MISHNLTENETTSTDPDFQPQRTVSHPPTLPTSDDNDSTDSENESNSKEHTVQESTNLQGTNTIYDTRIKLNCPRSYSNYKNTKKQKDTKRKTNMS